MQLGQHWKHGKKEHLKDQYYNQTACSWKLYGVNPVSINMSYFPKRSSKEGYEDPRNVCHLPNMFLLWSVVSWYDAAQNKTEQHRHGPFSMFEHHEPSHLYLLPICFSFYIYVGRQGTIKLKHHASLHILFEGSMTVLWYQDIVQS